MKRYLTTTEYRELENLVNHILTASSGEDAEAHIRSLGEIRSNKGHWGSISSILNELYSCLKIMPDKISNADRLSYFAFADSYLIKLKDYVQNEELTPQPFSQ